jgi:multiple sugar transport system substrate-binding protein
MQRVPKYTRRQFLLGSTAIASSAVAIPGILRSGARAAENALGPYLEAKINWRLAEGEALSVALIPTGFYKPLMAMAAEFQALTGVNVSFEEIPPGQIRNKTVLDLNSKTGTYSTSFTDPMYYPLYASNTWVDPIEGYLGDSKLTDPAWYAVDDIVPAWRAANLYDGKLYGVPFDGDATVQVFRSDLYAAHGLKPAQSFDEFTKSAAAINDPANRLWGTALRGFPGPGQNMYIYPSIFLAFGGKWFDANGKVKVNGPEAEAALQWYVSLDNKYAPKGVENWNWPDIADAFTQGTLGSYIDGASPSGLFLDPQRSKIIGKVDFARWPVGPGGRRVTSIWNWGFVMNGALSKRAKQANWLFIQWATCKETQQRTLAPPGSIPRLGANRLSILRSPEYTKIASSVGPNFLSAYLDGMEHDTDPDWRPRVPQWPAIGETMSVAIQQALVGQATPKAALDNAQTRIEQIMRA